MFGYFLAFSPFFSLISSHFSPLTSFFSFPPFPPFLSALLSFLSKIFFCFSLSFLQISTGLAYLHNLDPPIMHRDLKSPNIFLLKRLNREISLSEERIAQEPLAKIGDFGLSVRLDSMLASSLKVFFSFFLFSFSFFLSSFPQKRKGKCTLVCN